MNTVRLMPCKTAVIPRQTETSTIILFGRSRNMSFNSYIFILVFLPVFVILYLSIGGIRYNAGKLLIILGGIVFYVYAGWDIAAILGVSIAVNYLMSLAIRKAHGKKTLLALTIILNVFLLLYFKYLNFAIDTINDLAKGTIRHKDLILPLGISFFTFQQIMYIVSVWKGETDTGIVDYLAYILYFPKLVMGPLMEPVDFYEQINDSSRKTVDWGNVASGIKIFSLGLFKKMVLADTFAKAVNWGFTYGIATATRAPEATSGDLFLVMLFYTFQIYFDFSGYSDMAVGISKMLNIDLPVNFDSPYKATSIRDFWRRWHISLTNFLTRYVYFPLGGSKKGEIRTYANIMIVFLVSGIWHGANWTFILWGCIHGLIQVMERGFKNRIDKLTEVVRWGCTFFSVNVLWLLFRANSIPDFIELMRTMFKFQNMAISDDLIEIFELPENAFIFDKLNLTPIDIRVRGFGMLCFLVSAFLICLVPQNNYRRIGRTNAFHKIVCAIAFIWGFLCLSSESVFVYFGF